MRTLLALALLFAACTSTVPTVPAPPATSTPFATATPTPEAQRIPRPFILPTATASYAVQTCWREWHYSITTGNTTMIYEDEGEYRKCVLSRTDVRGRG